MRSHRLHKPSRMYRLQRYQQHQRWPQLNRRHDSIWSPEGRARGPLHSSERRGALRNPTRTRTKIRSAKAISLLLTTDGIRSWLAICITLLVSIVALVAAHETSADGVFGKLLPILTLVLGYYFGKTTVGSE